MNPPEKPDSSVGHSVYVDSAYARQAQVTLEGVRAAMAEVQKTAKELPEHRLTTLLVACDAWELLAAAIPLCRGCAFTAHGVTVRRCTWLPPGVAIPLDQNGNPMPKPQEKT